MLIYITQWNAIPNSTQLNVNAHSSTRDIVSCKKTTNDMQSKTLFRVWIQEIKWNCRVIKLILKTQVCSTAVNYMVRQSWDKSKHSDWFFLSRDSMPNGLFLWKLGQYLFLKSHSFPELTFPLASSNRWCPRINIPAYVHAKWRPLF